MTTQDLDNEFERSAASRAEAMPTEQDLAQIIADNERLRLAVERLTSAGLSAAQGEVAKEDELDYWIRSWTEKDVQNAALEKDNKRLRDALTKIYELNCELGYTLRMTRVGWDGTVTCENILKPINAIAKAMGEANPMGKGI